MRGFVWLSLALLLFLAWAASYVVFHVAGFAIHLLLVLALIAVLIDVYSETRD
ncbi:MAG TPA: lmo0937 family membrane protein [Chthoniobacterales bacterium]|nr:lmo0937 family membrane protein [Chthoniobacterales bacterium]